MSLISHLRNSNSPVTQFFHEYFPNTRGLTKEINTLIKQAQTIDTPGLAPWEYGLIGTAFDYRVRYFFAVTPYREYVAYRGAGFLTEHVLGELVIQDDPNGPYLLLPRSIQGFFSSLEVDVNQIQPVGRKLKSQEEKLIALYCLILALFEGISRSGPLSTRNSLLVQAFTEKKLNTVSDFFELCQDTWVLDMEALAVQFLRTSVDWLKLPVILNPVFEGSRDVGGADADLIIGDNLIDIKAKKKPNVDRRDLCQLLGYVLLDYRGSFNIRNVGFYLARQGFWHTWPLDKYIVTMGVSTPHNLSQLRAEFRATLKNTNP